ncbi:MAG: hypothetical protein GKR94_19460 [Gammaproteobacteria bacterium]|nr:hypothetical protein [Gammaproteobacteria bacterium]
MKKSVEAAIEQILRLRSQYSDADLSDAIMQLAASRTLSNRIDERHGRKKHETRGPSAERKAPEISKAVADLRGVDDERFELLARFDRALRRGEILTTLESIRYQGMRMDKSFAPGKSRRSAISKLLKLLVALPTADARRQIDAIVTADQCSSRSEEAYSELAAFLMGRRD